jgi:coenzyme F420-reducing hydrogenase delta subunit
LKTGIDLPDYPIKLLRERTIAACEALQGPTKILVFACEHGGAAGRLEGTVHLPCVGMAPPSLIDFVLSRKLADGVVMAGCAESAGFNRLGIEWTKQRFAGTRDPYLRARVPRERVATVWTSVLAQNQANAEIAAFTDRIAAMPPATLHSPLPPSSPSPRQQPARASEPAEATDE